MNQQLRKLKVPDQKLDLNLKFYFMLKHLVKTKLTDRQLLQFKEYLNLYGTCWLDQNASFTFALPKTKGGENQKGYLLDIYTFIEKKEDIDLLTFALNLYAIKDLLLEGAKFKCLLIQDDLKKLHPLSIQYDKKTLVTPYTTRVNGALLALLFFDKLETKDFTFCTEDATEFFSKLSKDANVLCEQGLEPNQIFMLMFSESINQSIISNSGSNYEDRIRSVLVNTGIPKEDITKIHDANDKSTEFDFFFTLEGKTIGIGAKRTLRERYKQFIKTAHTSRLDVMICITLGVDATEDKVRTICRQHNVILFVADEIYQEREYLQQEQNCYSVNALTLDTLKELANSYN
jgi:hypothetical protein